MPSYLRGESNLWACGWWMAVYAFAVLCFRICCGSLRNQRTSFNSSTTAEQQYLQTSSLIAVLPRRPAVGGNNSGMQWRNGFDPVMAWVKILIFTLCSSVLIWDASTSSLVISTLNCCTQQQDWSCISTQSIVQQYYEYTRSPQAVTCTYRVLGYTFVCRCVVCCHPICMHEYIPLQRIILLYISIQQYCCTPHVCGTAVRTPPVSSTCRQQYIPDSVHHTCWLGYRIYFVYIHCYCRIILLSSLSPICFCVPGIRVHV